MNIYIGNFSYDITTEELQEIFAAYGQVETARIIRDKFTGESKGFGFVEMPNKAEALAAMQGIKEIKGRKVTINEARPQEKSGSFGGKRGGPRGDNFNRKGGRY